jgi:outer membrane protein TolC
MKKTIHEYQQTLLPLLQKSYTYGESSVTEYILSKQQYYALLQSFYTAQISYYHALFGLYTLSETKETL